MSALLTRVAEHAAQRAETLAVESSQEEMTYGELWDRTRRLADELDEKGVAPGELVALESFCLSLFDLNEFLHID